MKINFKHKERSRVLIPVIALAAVFSATSIASTSQGNVEDYWPVLLDVIFDNDPYGDSDGDGLSNALEVQLGTDPNNPDTDGDGLSDGVEVNLGLNPLHYDSDLDGVSDADDLVCPFDPENDLDADGLCAAVDNCPIIPNPGQADADTDGIGDACDSMPNTAGLPDSDGDGIEDFDTNGVQVDNCLGWPNPKVDGEQPDENDDGIGDACQCGDIDNNGVVDNDDFIALDTYVSAGIAISMPLFALEKCDVDGDGVCTAWDRDKLAAYIADNNTEIRTSCPTVSQVADRALNRVAFGKNVWTSTRIADYQVAGGSGGNGYAGLESYIREQINPSVVMGDAVYFDKRQPYSDQPELDPSAPVYYPTYDWSIADLRSTYCFNTGCSRTPLQVISNQSELKVLRAAYSTKQLSAVLQDFWFNHFSVDGGLEIARWAHPRHEKTIAANMYGDFATLVEKSAWEPAMLDYLDQQQNTKNAENENFARELMELHTIGTDNTFIHDDIIAVAQVLTGNRYDGNFAADFDLGRHVTGETKEVTLGSPVYATWTFGLNGTAQCGLVTATGGANEARALICLLARHEKAAELVGTKLIARFLGDTAYDLAQAGILPVLGDIKITWAANDANLASVFTTLLLSDDFKKSLYYETAKGKRPGVFSASLIRLLGNGSEGSSDVPQGYTAARARDAFNGIMDDIKNMGEQFYSAGPPTGYSEETPAWLGGSVYAIRLRQIDQVVDFLDVAALADLGLPVDFAGDEEMLDRLAEHFLPGGLLSIDQKNIILDFLTDETALNNLPIGGLPRTLQAIKAVLSTPQFLAQ